MRHFKTLLFHVLKLALYSWNTWATAGLFLTLMGTIYWFALLECSRSPQPWTPVEGTFKLFWLPLLCILPLLTMRSFSEERRAGTLSSLLTTPASIAAIVWAKFLSAWITWVIFWLGFIPFTLLVNLRLGSVNEQRLSDPSVLIGALSFIFMSGLLHVAIGIVTLRFRP